MYRLANIDGAFVELTSDDLRRILQGLETGAKNLQGMAGDHPGKEAVSAIRNEIKTIGVLAAKLRVVNL